MNRSMKRFYAPLSNCKPTGKTIMNSSAVTIRIKGKPLLVPSLMIHSHQVITRGRILRIASVFDDFLDARGVQDPRSVVQELRRTRMADIFSFLGNFADWVHGKRPDWNDDYHIEYESQAAIQVESYDHWWKHAIDKKTRRRIKKSQEAGIKVCAMPLNDEFIRGIHRIFDETPVRQGKRFWHYGKGFNQVKEEISTYAERSIFIGAYLEGELIGFSKLINCREFGRANQFLSMVKHRNVNVNNALISELVRTCEEKEIPYLVYGDWGVGSLGEFKENNGFRELITPRYYKAVNARGAIALKTGLHKGVKALLPETLRDCLRSMRRSATSHLQACKKAYRGSYLIHPIEPSGAPACEKKTDNLSILR